MADLVGLSRDDLLARYIQVKPRGRPGRHWDEDRLIIEITNALEDRRAEAEIIDNEQVAEDDHALVEEEQIVEEEDENSEVDNPCEILQDIIDRDDLEEIRWETAGLTKALLRKYEPFLYKLKGGGKFMNPYFKMNVLSTRTEQIPNVNVVSQLPLQGNMKCAPALQKEQETKKLSKDISI